MAPVGKSALSYRVDFPVGGEQRGDQQGAAGQVGCVTEGGDRDVDAAAAAGECGQFRGHHDGGEVLGGKCSDLVARVHTQALEHAD
jgi:hypothetical protein